MKFQKPGWTEEKHLAWVKSLKPGDVVNDQWFVDSKIITIKEKYRLSERGSIVFNRLCNSLHSIDKILGTQLDSTLSWTVIESLLLFVGFCEWADRIVTLENGRSCLARDWLDPVKYP